MKFHKPYWSHEIEQKAMIAWLVRNGPDDWHFVAGQLHGASSADVVRWVTSQPQCDRSTAQMLFFRNWPEGFLHYATIGDAATAKDGQIGRIEWLKDHVDHWNAGFYRRAEINSDVATASRWNQYLEAEASVARSELPWLPDRSIGDLIVGRNLTNSISLDFELRALLEDLGTGFEFDSADEVAAYTLWRKARCGQVATVARKDCGS